MRREGETVAASEARARVLRFACDVACVRMTPLACATSRDIPLVSLNPGEFHLSW